VETVFCGGSGCITRDGFLMGKIKSEGSVQFYRTDSVWKKQTVRKFTRPPHLTAEKATNAKAETLDVSSNISKKKAVNTIVRDTTDNSNVHKAERDYEQLLSQITPTTLLPLLKSGSLSYPSLSRPTIWARLLQLPRNKKKYLKYCKANSTYPENILSNVFLWSPHIKLVPFIPSFLSPFLSLYSGHPTTSFEFCLTLLSRYTWLSDYPSPPPLLPLAWSLLSLTSPTLTTHLSSISVTSRTLFWSLLQSGWSTILPHSDWAQLWDHLFTTGPGLLVTALPATILCLQATLLSCTSYTMVVTLLSAQLAINMDELLTTAHSLLDTHQSKVANIEPDTGVGVTDASYSPPITLAREGREVLRDLWSDQSSTNSSITIFSPTILPTTHKKDYGGLIQAALAVSPPPLPRARTNQREALKTIEENIKDRPFPKYTYAAVPKPSSSFKPSQDNLNPMAPLQPVFPPTVLEPDRLGLPVVKVCGRDGEEGWEDITDLLQKAKLLRQVIQAKK